MNSNSPSHSPSSVRSNEAAARFQRARTWCLSSWAVIGSLFSIAYNGPALADCSPTATNDVIATCAGTTTTQYGTGAETNVTTTVSPGAAMETSTTAGNAAFSFYVASLTAYNYGSITATTPTALASGVYAVRNAMVTNAGSITATSGSAFAYGAYAGMNAMVTNSGSITATSGSAFAYGAYAGMNATVINSGSITATSGGPFAYGVYAMIYDATVTNSGLITATSGTVYAYGAYAARNATVTNSGSIIASGTDFAYGAYAATNATVTNSGSITATSDNAFAYGVNAGLDATVTNSGSITATSGDLLAYGVYAGTDAIVANSGSITASSGGGFTYGVTAGRNATVTNFGSVTATGGDSFTYGINAFNNATVTNSGSITATSGNNFAYGINAFNNATVTNTGSIKATSGNFAYGLNVYNATVTNSGSITALSVGSGAFGVNSFGATSLVNTGTISAVSGLGDAYAIRLSSQDDTITLGAGSKLIGRLSLGGGADTISFIGGNHNLTFSTGDLASAIFTDSTIPYTVSGDRAAALDPTSFAANTTMLQSTTRVISSLAPDFVPARDGAKALPVLSYAPEPAAFKLPEGPMAHVADAPLKSQTAVSADGTAIWTRVFGGQSYEKADGVLVGFRNSYYGGAIGIDRPVDANLRYGVFLGGLSSTSKLALNYGDTDSKMGFVGAYVRYASGATFVKVGLQAGYGSNESTRRTNNNLLASGIETATSNTSNWYISPEISFGHEFALGHFLNGDVSVTPTGQLRHLAASFGSYSENGGTDSLRMDGHTAQIVEERLTFKVSHVSNLTSDYQLKLDVIGGVLGTQRVSGGTLSGTLLGQSIQFSEPGKANRKAATAGLGAEVSKGLTSFFVAGEYIAQPNGVFDYSGRAGASIRF